MGIEDSIFKKKKASVSENPPEVVKEEVVEEEPATESVASPEILEEVSFRLITDKRGEPVRYKSSAMGRKEVRLDPSSAAALSGVDMSRSYRVKVISDSDPSDPLKGYYLAEIVSELEHKDAQRARARRLRESNGFKTVGRMLNDDPDLSQEYRTVVARHQEYHGLHTDDEARHRNFTGMLSALMMSERGKNLLDRVIDRTITTESNVIKERLRDQPVPPYVPGITIGAGVYGAVLAATRQMYLPEVPDLTIDQNDRVGGQFAQYRTDLFRLNSRRRPEMPDAPHLPGTKQSLNSFGEHSVMQSSDTGAESYPYQSTIADTARANFFLSGKALVSTELRRIRENTEGVGQGKLILELYDKDTERILEVATDRVTFSTGLGEEADNLDPNDQVTRSILEEEKKKLSQGADARVMSFTEFAQRMSDPTNPFPLKDMKRIVLSGTGDSANVVAGILLGYETQLGKTAAQLDNIEEIIWIGQAFASKEEFLRNTRTRYAAIGLEFPRERFERYYSRIRTIAGKSQRLRRTDAGIRVELNSRFTGNQFSSPVFVEGDHFIYTHGFNDTTDKVIGTAFTTEVFAPEEFSDALYDVRYNVLPNYSISYKEGYVRRIDLLSTTYNDEGNILVELGILQTDGRYVNETITQQEFSGRSQYFEQENIDRIEITSTPDDFDFRDATDLEYGKVRNRLQPIAKSFRTSNDGRIFKVGPSANLDLRREEIREAPALESIKENTAAIFRYVDSVQAFGEITARRERGLGVTAPALFADLQSRKTETLPSVKDADDKEDFFRMTIRSGGFESIGIEERSDDLLKLAVGDSLSSYVFPDDLKRLELTIVRTGKGRSATAFTVLSEPPLSEAYDAVIQTLKKDTLAAGVIKKITDNVRSNAITVRIPIERGKAVGANTTYELYRVTEEERKRLSDSL